MSDFTIESVGGRPSGMLTHTLRLHTNKVHVVQWSRTTLVLYSRPGTMVEWLSGISSRDNVCAFMTAANSTHLCLMVLGHLMDRESWSQMKRVSGVFWHWKW